MIKSNSYRVKLTSSRVYFDFLLPKDIFLHIENVLVEFLVGVETTKSLGKWNIVSFTNLARSCNRSRSSRIWLLKECYRGNMYLALNFQRRWLMLETLQRLFLCSRVFQLVWRYACICRVPLHRCYPCASSIGLPRQVRLGCWISIPFKTFSDPMSFFSTFEASSVARRIWFDIPYWSFGDKESVCKASSDHLSSWTPYWD